MTTMIPPNAMERARTPLIVATIAREQGITGVHTHVRQLRRYLDGAGGSAEIVTPHHWARGSMLRNVTLLPVFGVRLVLERIHGPSNVRWYRHSHEQVLRHVLRRRLHDEGACVVYAQCPLAARAALDARTGTHQRVVMAVHFRISQADEWAHKGQISRWGSTFRSIREAEQAVIPRVDGLVYVSAWARDALHSWCPAAAEVEGTVVNNFVERPPQVRRGSPTGDLVSVGNLEAVKNHRYLLRVLAAAASSGHRYTLDVFGEGVERRHLLALAQELGIVDLVRLRGFCPDVQARLSGYQAYVHASYSESSSLAIMEAMAAGLPVVSSSEGALPELFEDQVQGRFWPIDDPEEAARILVDLIESPSALAAASRAASAKFSADYDADVVAPRLLRFLNGVVAGG